MVSATVTHNVGGRPPQLRCHRYNACAQASASLGLRGRSGRCAHLEAGTYYTLGCISATLPHLRFDSIEIFQPSGGSIEAAPQSKMSPMPMSPEQRLWRHVLLAILAILADLQSLSEQTLRDKDFARRWVGPYPSRDFRMVCNLSGLDPDCVHRHFKRIAKSGRSGAQGVSRSKHNVPRGQQHLNGRVASDVRRV